VYGRVGTCTQEFGTLASWAIDALNVLTGNLDREGGVMWSQPLAGGDRAQIRSAAATLVVPVELSDEVARGVVHLPHGFGHGRPGARLASAAKRPGVNLNALADASVLDAPSGAAVPNGIPVESAGA
jgi:anaerobic selenocysteine-containing dehydrogenase